ncbi:MAG: hypothetical protein ABIJ00_11535 [Candidatus Eisenbacteria bacterium]
MKHLAVTLAALLVITVAGCDDEDPCRTVCDSEVPHDVIMFDALDDISLHADDLTIREIGLTGDILYFKVEYGGGCMEHGFDLYGRSAFLESDPPQASVYLSHNANGDDCEALITGELEFSLVPLKHAYQRAYDDGGPMLLRIYAPGAPDPIQPLILYAF